MQLLPANCNANLTYNVGGGGEGGKPEGNRKTSLKINDVISFSNNWPIIQDNFNAENWNK